MSRKRTKKNKRRAKQHRQQVTVNQDLSQQSATTSNVGRVTYKLDEKMLERTEKKPAVSEIKLVSLLGYDEKLLKRDLTRTMILTFVVFGLEIGLWMYLNK